MKINDLIDAITNTVKQEMLNCNPSFKVIEVYPYDEGYKVYTQKYINDCLYKQNRYLKCNEEIQDFVERVNDSYDYIEKLWNEYPEYCRINEILQELRIFHVEGVGTIKLTGKLELPNTTECSVGGGDYEIKRTPQREKDFLKNIDKYTLLFSESIIKLQKIRSEFLSRREVEK